MSEKSSTGTLVLVCTATGGEIDSGVVYSQADLTRAKQAKLLLHCRHCRKQHQFKFCEARLKPLRRG
jgi:hypothetical protein